MKIYLKIFSWKNILKKCLYNIMMNISLMNDLMKNMLGFMKMNEANLAHNMICELDVMLLVVMKCFSENVMLLVVMKCYEMNGGRKMEKGQGVP